MTTSERLLPYYQRELQFIRHLALDFHGKYPELAERLKLDAAAKSNDPHVERMIEAFALLTANTQVKLDDEFPELTDAMLQVLYPHYLAPIPSMTILQFTLNTGSGDSPNGYVLPGRSALKTEAVKDGVMCEYRTGGATTLWPIEIVEAKFRPPPYDIEPDEEIRSQVKSYLRLRIKCTGALPLEEMNLDALRLYLLGDSQLTVGLYEMLLTELKEVVFVPENRRSRHTRIKIPSHAVRPVGFEPEDALLPYPKQSFAGYQLLTEFFAYAGRFSFIDLCGWKAARDQGLAGKTVDVVFYFTKPPRDGLVQGVSKLTFVPGCAAAINLFSKTAEAFPLTHRKAEYPIEPDVHSPNGYEVYSVDAVTQLDMTKGEPVEYRPFYSFRHETGKGGPPYWHASRTARFRQRVDGRRDDSSSVGTDVALRLVNLDLDPQQPSDLVVTIQTTCLNRDLPRLLREAGDGVQFYIQNAVPVKVRCLRPPTPTMRPPLRRQAFWRLLSHLHLNHLSLTESEQGTQTLQEYLRLYDFSEGNVAAQVVSGLLKVRSSRDVQFIKSSTGGGYARGVKIDIELDDEKYAGVGAYLFGSILERFLSLYVSINSFTRLTVKTNRKDADPWEWPPRAGGQVLA